jgi:hypothetical protein
MCARDDEIVGKPSRIARLPVNAGYLAEINAKPIRSAEEVEEQSGSRRVLVAEAAPASHLYWRFLLHDFLPPCHKLFVRINSVF